MTNQGWEAERLDLAGYLRRLGVSAQPVDRTALDELHEAHVRSFSFDNIDVLLEQHPGVGLDAVQEKFVGRGRGGYCFEHSTILAAALERLGYDVERRLARVGDPARGEQQGRTHMVVEVRLDGERLLCDAGFGMSRLRSIPLNDGAEDDYLGWAHRVRGVDDTWVLDRHTNGGWAVQHTTDELPVTQTDVVMGHHFTSTFPTSHFRRRLIICRHLPGRHVTLTHREVTVRRAGETTEHRQLAPGELGEWLEILELPLSGPERDRLLARAGELP